MEPRFDDGPDHRAGGRHEPGPLRSCDQPDRADYPETECLRTAPCGPVIEEDARTDGHRPRQYLGLAGVQAPGGDAARDFEVFNYGDELEGSNGVGGPVSGVAGFELSQYSGGDQQGQRERA